jgi:uncharacterized protein (TIGR04255 family)
LDQASEAILCRLQQDKKDMKNESHEGPLPNYLNPPVVEVILGVQFDRLHGFSNAHPGAFWNTLDPAEWPTVSDAPPLEPQFETFGESITWKGGQVQIRLTQDLSSRLQIKNRNGDRLIQVQNGRLHFNWLGQAGGSYPRYDKVRESFVWALQKFIEFIAAAKFGDFRPNQWEVTYLNHIPRGTVWNTPREWDFFRLLGPLPEIEGLVQGESFGGEWHFIIPEHRGRLHVAWQHGRKTEPKEEELIVLTLTARGPLDPNQAAVQPVLSGLDLGRATIVRSFNDFMTNKANRYWGLQDVSD